MSEPQAITHEITLQPVTFDRLERLCLCLGVHPDDVLTRGAAAVVEAVKDPSLTQLQEAVPVEGNMPDNRLAWAFAAVEYAHLAQKRARQASDSAQHYIHRTGFMPGGEGGTSLSMALAGLEATDEDAFRQMPLEDMLFRLLMRAIHASQRAHERALKGMR